MFRTSLKDISKAITSGLTPLRSNGDFWKNGEISWLKTEQIGNRHIYETNEYISKNALEQTSIKIIPSNAITIAMYGEGRTRGSVSIIKTPMTTNQACCNVIVDDTKADYNYIYYFLKTQYNNLRALSSGVRKNLNSEDIKTFQISVPDLKAQQKIAKVLSILDDKIELNNRINDNLEQMAKTLYDYWFVQFDFPTANGKPYKTSGGKMVWSKELKREIPDKWEVKVLGDLGNFKNGVNYDPSNPGEIACPIINVRNISASSYFLKNEDLDIIYLRASDVRKYAVHNDSIIIARSGIPGATRLISDFEENTLYCGFAIHYELLDLNKKILIFLFLKSIEQQIQNGSEGTILKNVNQGTLNSLQIALPNENSYFSKFNELIQPMFSKINLIQKENQRLTELREWLLPMLMNGQVKID
jgi:type I restriction enzyme S subunit